MSKGVTSLANTVGGVGRGRAVWTRGSLGGGAVG